MLRNRIDCAYAGEVNDVWRQVAGKCRHDMIPASYASPENCELIRRYFDRVGSKAGKSFVLEKTAANSLRMPFVYRVFPDAVYIHIIRDGRDVAISAQRKYRGDIRKITRTSGQQSPSAMHRMKFLASTVRKKLSLGLSPAQLLRDMGRYSSGAMSVIGLKRQTMWGPRFPGMKELVESHSLLEVAGLQWRESMEAMASFVETNKSMRLIELKFEDLISDPDKELDKILTFLGDNVPRLKPSAGNDIVPLSVSTSWRGLLQKDEINSLHELMLSTLQRFGYSESGVP